MEFMFIHRVISLENIGVYHLIANFKNDGVEHMCFISYQSAKQVYTEPGMSTLTSYNCSKKKKETQELQNHQKWNELKAGRDRYKPCYLGVFLPPSHAYSLRSLALFMKSANICLHTQAGAADWWPFYHFVAIGDIFVYDSIL
jgi:hypothetical protein